MPLSISFIANRRRSEIPALSPNRGSHALESTSSPISTSDPLSTSTRGRGLSQTPLHHPRIIPVRCPFVARDQSPPRTLKRVVGFGRLVTSCDWNCGTIRWPRVNLDVPSFHSTISCRRSSLFAWFRCASRHHKFSASRIRFPSSRT